MLYRFLAVCLIASLLVFATSPVQAQLPVIDTSGAINELEDIDFETIIGGDGDDFVEEDEFLVAILQVSRLNSIVGVDGDDNGSTSSDLTFEYSESTRTFTAVSLLKVASVSGAGTGLGLFGFAAPTPAEWAFHTGLLGVDPGTLGVFFSDPATGDHVDEAAPGGLAAAIATAADGIRLWEVGFTGLPEEFWFAQTTAPFGGDATNINEINTLFFLSATNVIDDNGALPLVKHNALGDPDLTNTLTAALFSAPVHVQLQGNLDTGDAGHFDVTTDTNIYILPTPEPGSMVAWAGIALISVCGARRRRVRKA